MKKNFCFIWEWKIPELIKLLRVMKLTIILCLFSAISVLANKTYSQTKTLKLNMQGGTVKEILNSIEEQSEFYFMYSEMVIDVNRKVDLNIKNQKVETTLDLLFEGTDVNYTINDRIIVLTTPEVFNADSKIAIQQNTISGTVSNVSGEPLPGVTVVLKGTAIGTATDMNGNYSISNVPETAILQFSFIGMKSQEIELAGKRVIDVVMEEASIGLDEVVAIGYGTQKKSELTGSISTISKDEYENQAVVRVDQILQGRSAGVAVTSGSGAPGGSVQVRIRGANSITGNNDPLYVIDGFVGADFRDLNPSDIESLQVLKDAASTAIYGSRGSNGVVLITTKGGQGGKSKVSFTARYISSEVINRWDLMDAATFARTVNERALALNPNSNLKFSENEIAEFERTGGTDWQDEVFQTGSGQEYQLDYSGGNEKMKYFISGNYYGQDGVVMNSGYQRFSLRTNLHSQLASWLSADLKMNFSSRETLNTEGEGDVNTSPMNQILGWAPTTPARDANGIPTLFDPISSIKINPLEIAEQENINQSTTFNAFGGFDFLLLDGLTLNVSGGITHRNNQNKQFDPAYQANKPTASRGSSEYLFLQNTNNLTYSKLLNDIHRLTATAVFENQVIQNDFFSASAQGLIYPSLKYDNITLATSISNSANKSKSSIRSYIGRANYAFKDKYLISASIRHDGSSKFRGDNRYSTFPSVGLGWRLSDEDFISDLGFFNNFKIRASWGKTGSQGIPAYGTVTLYNTSDANAAASFSKGTVAPGVVIGNPGNPDLKWETTKQSNIGLDMSILEGRLSAEFDYFYKVTNDLLLQQPVPQYAGGGNISNNIGEVKNRGFEFKLDGLIINSGGFSWNSSLNMSFLTNEVTNIGEQKRIFLDDGGAGAGLTNASEFVILPGYSVSTFWGYKFLGLWQSSEASEAAVYGAKPGDSKYHDLNDDKVINGSDLQPIGNAIPGFVGGWNNTMTWKAFTLNAFFQSMAGFDKLNISYATAMLPTADAREITHSDIANRWIAGKNENTDIPAFSNTNRDEVQSTRFIEKGDFIRLKNLSLTYNLPKNFVKGINGSLTASGLNLWTITNYRGLDPESFSFRGNTDARGSDGGSYPNSKTWTLSLNLTF